MAEPIKEIAESAISFGDMVVFLTTARDMAQLGASVQMNEALTHAERAWNSFRHDCRVICEIREGEQ